MYGTGNICEALLNRRSLYPEDVNALELKTNKPDSRPWDVRTRDGRDLAIHLICSQPPLAVIGSPPCTAFSTWNADLNYAYMPAHAFEELQKF